MTIFDLLFIALLLAALVTLITALVSALRGRRREAVALIRILVLSALAYIGMVYLATALSTPKIYRLKDPQCNDDWCVAVEDVRRTPAGAVVDYDVTIRIFSRARRAQRENIARDVYLVDTAWNRYDPLLDGSEIPLNTLLQPLESVMTRRHFKVPKDAQGIALKIGHGEPPFCLIIGECEAFHRGPIVRLD